MLWKQELRKLEDIEQFEKAIELMKEVIAQDPNDVDRYIFMLYFLADLIVEPHIRMTNNQGVPHFYNKEYEALAKRYFDESYSKFVNHSDKHIRAQYLYYVGRIAVFAWYLFGIDDMGSQMIEQARHEDPENPVYKLGQPGQEKITKQLLDASSEVRKILTQKGSIGDYLIGIFKRLIPVS